MRGIGRNDLVQSPVKQMSDCVVALDRVATGFVHGDFHFTANRWGVSGIEDVQPCVADFLGIGNAPELAAAGECRCVTNLPAHFGIASGRIQDDGCLVLDRKNL